MGILVVGARPLENTKYPQRIRWLDIKVMFQGKFPEISVAKMLSIRFIPSLRGSSTTYRTHTGLIRLLSHSNLVNAEQKDEIIKFKDLDAKWTHKWRELSPDGSLYPLSKVDGSAKDKKYILSMFPYPSGVLHLGHVRVYTISDSISRFHRAKGTTVIHPMGWDAFGLPAENAAIERNVNPGVWTRANIEKMKTQMNSMLVDFDWEREVTTCNDDYYKWTQKIFLLLFEDGLAYRKEAEINWDPVDQTVLANEQVDAEGKSWRSGALVEKRLLSQWFLGITKFASALNKDLNTLEEWPSKVKTMQKHWIGESHGADIIFKSNNELVELKAFTTRPDTIYSIQYVAIARDHPLAKNLASSNPELKSFIEAAKDLPEDSKAGFELPNIKLANPLKPGEFDIPVFVAPYVLGNYGEGVVMGCPGHDIRDFEFWKENKPSEPVIKTIIPADKKQKDLEGEPFTDKGKLSVQDPELNGLPSKEATKKIVEKLTTLGLGNKKVQFKIRDWLISRQRYWGAPIPIIHCGACGPVAVPDKDLPVRLPEDVKIVGKGNPLANLESFVNVDCPSCGAPAKRDTDTMDTFMDSSWYFFRYVDPKNTSAPFDSQKASSSLPVDIYIGGVEHAILHLLYSRFISKFLASKSLWDGSSSKGEPFKKLVTQGMVHGETFINPTNGRFLKPEELDFSNPKNPIIKETGETPKISFEKMSKSKYNGADPGECIEAHGADATRAHILFQAPVSDILDWDESKIVGIERWLRRVLQISKEVTAHCKANNSIPTKLNDEEIKFHNEVEFLVKSITESFDVTLSLNTVISDYMKITNACSSALESDQIHKSLVLKSIKKLLVVMSPVTPATAEEGWEILKVGLHEDWSSVLAEKWPESEPLIESNITKYNIFFNGKMRFTFEADKNFYKNARLVEETLIQHEQAKKYLKGKTIKKIIAKNKAISFVIV